MSALTLAQIKPAGTVETAICELCHKPFEFTHNGEWLPVSCPNCAEILALRMEQALAMLKEKGWRIK